jgi:hypothetical protein
MGRRLLLTVAVVLGLASPASAANGVTPLSPKSGATVPEGKSPRLRARVHGPGQVWVRVCGSRRTNSGLICATDAIGRMKRGRFAVFSFRPKFHDFAGFWLNRPGTYYWQAYRIACKGSRCRQPGPIVAFKVG